jgi:hypothetical protein
MALAMAAAVAIAGATTALPTAAQAQHWHGGGGHWRGGGFGWGFGPDSRWVSASARRITAATMAAPMRTTTLTHMMAAAPCDAVRSSAAMAIVCGGGCASATERS